MEMGRRRDAENRDLPANLYPASRGRFEYINPVTGKSKFWTVPRERAIEAAKKLNQILLPLTNDLVARTLNEGQLVRDAVKLFREEDLAKRKLSASTRAIVDIRVAKIDADCGALRLRDCTVKWCAEYLRTVTHGLDARMRYRALLHDIFAGAVQEGWIDANPVAITKRVRTADIEKKRQRLSLEGYKAIHAEAPSWLQNAMDVALVTLLRRGDLCRLQFSDYRDGKLHVVPAKTKKSTKVRLRIDVPEALIARCRDAVVSPYLIHRLPGKAKPHDKRAKSRRHNTEVLPEQLTRAFDEARDKAKVHEGQKHPPTFHEIRSLGGKLLLDSGWTLEQVQRLMGHASEDMTAHYQAGHEAPWTDVRPSFSSEIYSQIYSQFTATYPQA